MEGLQPQGEADKHGQQGWRHHGGRHIGDALGTMRRVLKGLQREWVVHEAGDANGVAVIGRVAGKGWSTSCMTAAIWSSIALTGQRTT